MTLKAVLLFVISILYFIYWYQYKIRSNDKFKSSQKTETKDLSRIKNFSYVLWLSAYLFLALSLFSRVLDVLSLYNLFEIDQNSFFIFGFLVSLFGFYLFFTSINFLNECYSPCSSVKIPNSIKTQGPYKFIRHPIYTGNLFFIFGMFITSGSLAIGLILIVLYF
ncbi:MAG: hypothetical protein KDD45_05235, partial [Bdellovibrionales bacterium]|nr:hypothetical protein [Bdellovibrionales bacterium]